MTIDRSQSSNYWMDICHDAMWGRTISQQQLPPLPPPPHMRMPRLSCRYTYMLNKACKSRNLAAGRDLPVFWCSEATFYFNSPAGPLYGLLGRLAGPDTGPARAGLEDA
jgi:hypothetical protein